MAQPSTTDKKKSGNFPIVQAGCDPSSSLASFTLTRCSSWIIQITKWNSSNSFCMPGLVNQFMDIAGTKLDKAESVKDSN